MSLEGLGGLVNRIIAWADRLQREHGVLWFPPGSCEAGRSARRRLVRRTGPGPSWQFRRVPSLSGLLPPPPAPPGSVGGEEVRRRCGRAAGGAHNLPAGGILPPRGSACDPEPAARRRRADLHNWTACQRCDAAAPNCPQGRPRSRCFGPSSFGRCAPPGIGVRYSAGRGKAMGTRRRLPCGQPSSALARFFCGCGSPVNAAPEELSAGRRAISCREPVATDIRATQAHSGTSCHRCFHPWLPSHCRRSRDHTRGKGPRGNRPAECQTDGMTQIYRGTHSVNKGVITQADVKQIS